MLTQNKLIYICTILFLLSSISFGNEELAIVTKSKGNVDYKKSSSSEFQKTVKSGLELYNDDLLKTGDNGFVMFVYLDDGSLIKVHKNSEVYITGKIQDKNINKRVNAGDGFFRFDVKEQKGDEFTVVTPSSVASVKGTDFVIDVGPEGDIFYGFDGIVDISNKISNTRQRLEKDNKVESLKTGNISVDIMTEQDYIIIDNIESEVEVEEQEVEPEDDDGSGSIDQIEETVKEIRITVLNEEGEEKEIIIRYTE